MNSWVKVKKGIHALSQFHENEKIIRWVQGLKIINWLTPKRRRVMLALGAVLAGGLKFYNQPTKWAIRLDLDPIPWISHALAIPILFVLLYLFFLLAREYTTVPEPIKQRPQLFLHLLFWGLLLFVWWTPDFVGRGRTVFVVIVVTFPYLLWRIGYMLKSGQRGNATHTTFGDHLFYLCPVWGGNEAAYGKGFDYLSQHEAQTPEAYGRAILAGLKLLGLSVLWFAVNRYVIEGFVYGDRGRLYTFLLGDYSLGLPFVRSLMKGEVSYSPLIAWISLYGELVRLTLILAIHYHWIIGILRLCGFNVFRNTYKPLLSETLLDFWSRYNHYFKELLVQFFFFPTYLRYFRTKPILRIFVATFAAAFLGNIYFHLLQRPALFTGDIETAWHEISPRLLYCFLLATGIFLSMLRQQQQRGKREDTSPWWGKISRVRKIAGVWTFFSLIHIADWGGDKISWDERISFFLSLFGM